MSDQSFKGRRALFVVPARGGSKGVPGKNLRQLAGVPLVGWAVRAAGRAAQLLDGMKVRVVCSTDDPEIARAAREWGAEVPFDRPASLAGDEAASEGVVLHALEWFAARGETFDLVVRLQLTAPLTSPQDIVAALHAFLAGDGSPVTTVVEARPPSWTFALDGGRLREVLPEPPGTVRRQDLPRYFALTGAVSVTSPERLKRTGQIIEPTSLVVVTPPERSIDIDTEDDLRATGALLAGRAVAPMRVGDREIGPGQSCYVIAEAGVNHNGDLARARGLVAAAAAAGADAVKFQTWITAKLLSPDAPLAAYQQRNVAGERTQFEMLESLELPYEAHRELKDQAESLGLDFLSTPDEEDSADFLERLDVGAFKIGSAEITNRDFLTHVARKGRPLIVSTGMATLLEVERAVRAIEATGNRQIVLLHCVSNYPCQPEECNLRAMDTLQAAFGYPVGFSDHSLGHTVAVAAVARGAVVLEKHLTLDTSLPGPDHAASLDPAAFAAMMAAIRAAERALGNGTKEPTASELVHRPVMRKRWVAARDLAVGVKIVRADLVLRRGRPEGFDPADSEAILGRVLKQPLSQWETLTPEMLG